MRRFIAIPRISSRRVVVFLGLAILISCPGLQAEDLDTKHFEGRVFAGAGNPFKNPYTTQHIGFASDMNSLWENRGLLVPKGTRFLQPDDIGTLYVRSSPEFLNTVQKHLELPVDNALIILRRYKLSLAEVETITSDVRNHNRSTVPLKHHPDAIFAASTKWQQPILAFLGTAAAFDLIEGSVVLSPDKVVVDGEFRFVSGHGTEKPLAPGAAAHSYTDSLGQEGILCIVNRKDGLTLYTCEVIREIRMTLNDTKSFP